MANTQTIPTRQKKADERVRHCPLDTLWVHIDLIKIVVVSDRCRHTRKDRRKTHHANWVNNPNVVCKPGVSATGQATAMQNNGVANIINLINYN